MTEAPPVTLDSLKLHVGDRIEGTVVVNDLNYYVTEVKVAAPR
jgi:hypothetical protein